MCEIFGFTANEPKKINDYLKTFYSHCNNHPHGWGFANFQKDEQIIEKEPIKATDSEYLQNKLANPICVDNALAHIRLATKGCLTFCNCHPFLNKDKNQVIWTLIHNGTIFNFPKLDQYSHQCSGRTDSERILSYIIDKINEADDDLSFEQKFNVLSRTFKNLSKNNNKVNVMLSDGEYIYIHSNLLHSVHYLHLEGVILFSTLPLTEDKWSHLPINTLFAFKMVD